MRPDMDKVELRGRLEIPRSIVVRSHSSGCQSEIAVFTNIAYTISYENLY
jgi:hypothetical protein